MAVKYQRYWDSDEKKYKYRQISGFDEPKKTTEQIYEDSLKTDYKGFTGSGTTSAKEKSLESKAKTVQKKTTTDWSKSRAGAQGQATTKTAGKTADKVQFDFDNILAPKKVSAKTDNTDILFSSPFENRVKLGEELTAFSKESNKKTADSESKNNVITTPTVTQKGGGGSWGPDDVTAESVRNKLTIENDLGLTPRENGGAGSHLKYQHMTDEEALKYASLEGEEQKEYLESLEDVLSERLTEDILKEVETAPEGIEKNILTTIESVGAGWDDAITGLWNMPSLIEGSEDTVPKTPLTKAVDQFDLEGGAKVASDFGRTGGFVAPSMLFGAASAGAGLVPAAANAIGSAFMGMSSAGSTYGSTLEEGYSPDQARVYGIINGALEGGLQFLLGGIKGVSKGSGLFKTAAKKLTEKLIKAPAVVQKIASLAVSAGDEFTEEWLQAVIDPFVRNSVLEEDNDLNPFTWDKLYQGLIGAVMGFGTNVPSEISTPALDSVVGAETMEAIKGEDTAKAMGTVQADAGVESAGQEVTIPTRREAGMIEVTDEGNRVRYEQEIDGVFDGSLPLGEEIILGRTPETLALYGAPDLPLHMTQTTARKIAYPEGYQGGRHNLGIQALKDLPAQLSDPIAILTNKSRPNSVVVITEWNDMDGNRVIVPVEFNSQGTITVQNSIKTAFGRADMSQYLGENNENLLYTQNEKDINELLSQGRQLPVATRSDVSTNNIDQNAENVNTAGKSQTTRQAETDNSNKNDTQYSIKAEDTGRAMGTLPEAAVVEGEANEEIQPVQDMAQEYETYVTGSGIVPYTEKEGDNLSSYRGVVNGKDMNFSDFITKYKNASEMKRFYFGKISSELAQDIEQELGSNFDGYNVAVRNYEIRHTFKDHGDPAIEEPRGQIAVTDELFSRLPEVFNKPDSVVALDKPDYAGRQAFEVQKQINGYAIAVTGISDGRKTLEIDSFRVINKKKHSTTSDAGNQPQTATPETSSRAASLFNIAPEGTDVNMAGESQTTRQKETDNSNKNDTQYSIARENRQNAISTPTAAPEVLNLMDIHNQIKNGAMLSAEGLSGDTAGFLQALGERSGVNIEIGPIYQNGVRVRGAEGRYDAATNTIRFSPEATRADAVCGVAMHELTHSIESSEDYGAYRDFALEYMFGGDEDAYHAAITAKQAQYAGDGIDLSTEAAEKEVVAEFTRDTLFADEEAVDRLVQTNPSIARRIYEAIRAAIQKIRAYLGNARSIETLKLERGRKLFERALGRSGVTGNGDQSLSVKNSSLMGNVAFIDKKLIKKRSGESFNAAIRRFFNEHFKGKEIETIEDKNSVTFDQIGKYLYPGKTVTNYNTKRVAGNILDDIIRVSENRRHLPDLMINGQKRSHAGLDASGGWDYYDTKFAVDNSGEIWGGTVIVRISKNGKSYFYDLDKIKEVGYQDVNEFNPVKYSLSTSNNSISNFDKKSNLMDIHNQIKNGAMLSAEGLSGDTAGFLQALGEKSGVNIEIGPIYQNGVRVRGAEGRYDAATNTIRFSPEATRADAVCGVAMHELTHSIESSEDYGAYRDFAVEYMFGGDEDAYHAAITEKQAQYAGDGIDLSPEAAEKEVVAEFTRYTLFADEEAAARLARSNPSIARRIYEAIRAAIQKIKVYLGNASSIETLKLERGRKLFERALGTSEGGTGIDEQYVIKNIPNTNKRYVKADRQVIRGNTPKEWAQSVENYINKEIRSGRDVDFIAEDGDVLTITADTAGKAKFRNEVRMSDGSKRWMTESEFLAKLRAEAHIDELAQVSKRGKKTVPDYKNHVFAKDGFNYRTAYFEDADGQYYKVTMSVGKNGTINTIYNVGRMQTNTKFSLGAQRPEQPKTATENSVFSNSISNFDKKSNLMRH